MAGDTSTIVVICVGGAVVGACLAVSLAAAVLDRVWRRFCIPKNALVSVSPADATAAAEAGRRASGVTVSEVPAPRDPYLICGVCGAPALYPDYIGGADPPPFFWEEDDWPPPRPAGPVQLARPRSRTH